MRAQQIGLILLTGLALGSSVVVTRMGVREIAPMLLVVLRLAITTLAFVVTLIVMRRRLPREPRVWLDITIAGLIGVGFSMIAVTVSLQFISSGMFTILLALNPLITSLLAHVWLAHEKLNRVKLAGLAMALGGVMLLILTRTTGLAGNAGLDVRGILIALVGVAGIAIGLVYTRRRLQAVDPIVVTAGQIGVSLVGVTPFALALNPSDVVAISQQGWLSVVYISLVGSYLGFLLTFVMVQRFGATASTLPFYVMPVVAATLGVLLQLGETVTLPMIGGAALILSGVFLVSR